MVARVVAVSLRIPSMAMRSLIRLSVHRLADAMQEALAVCRDRPWGGLAGC